MSGPTPQDLAQWRHLVLKLRWMGLEHDARRLQSVVGSMHLKAELARQPEPPIFIELGDADLAAKDAYCTRH
jgi:hypothetical protein